jgi:hypothetical protein
VGIRLQEIVLFSYGFSWGSIDEPYIVGFS